MDSNILLIRAIKTEIVTRHQMTLSDFVDKYVELSENSVVVIASKVISVLEDRFIENSEDLDDAIIGEADLVSKAKNQYNQYLTIKHNAFIGKAGIDRSNANNAALLLPKNPQETAEKIHHLLLKKYNIENFGVIITDSRSLPLRAGVVGVAIGFKGFAPLRDYVGEIDLFGKKLEFEKANIVDSLAGAAVLAMGEGNEQTPIAIIEEADFVEFDASKPSLKELKEFYLTLENDYFHQLYKDLFIEV